MWKKLMQVQSSDPEDTRRRNLLNILLFGILASAIIGFLIVGYGLATKLWVLADTIFLVVILLIFISGALIIYFINRRWGRAAIYLFLALLVVAYAFSDTPAQVSNGSSVFFYAIPIVIASLLIHPLASFVVALIGCGIITWAAGQIGNLPNFIVIIGFFMLALISWLISRSLEDALRNLRQINANLDQLVRDRTEELANALSRERVGAGRIQAILDSIADGVIVFNLNGIAIIANPSSVRLLDIPYDKIIGSTIEDLADYKALDKVSRTILAGLSSSPADEMASRHIQWGRNTLSLASSPVNDTQGAHIGTVAVFRDYTHEAEVDRMKDTFLAIVSHELRTPLNAILDYGEMIKEGIYGPVTERQVRVAERIMTNSHRLLDIVSDLLDQAQIEAGKLSLHIQPFRPSDLLENIHTVMDKIATDKGLQFTSELDPDLPEYIKGDSARLQQILVNLINNGIKFTEKGSIHLSMLRASRKTWSLKVQDTGIGIPEDQLPNIFEAFRQVDSTATRKYGGVGLGLSIVKQLTELMEGNLTVESGVGEGSSFTITLPLMLARRIGE
jgi:signal transduction histidine kinase